MNSKLSRPKLNHHIFPPQLLPGVSVCLLFSHTLLSMQALAFSTKTGRSDVCAQPHGINSPVLFAYLQMIIGPIFNETEGSIAYRASIAYSVGPEVGIEEYILNEFDRNNLHSNFIQTACISDS
jgi:hypothetical protein